MRLHRHPCGVIYTQEFADHLAATQAAEEELHVGEMLSIDYVRCASGPQAGSEWYQMAWIAAVHAPQADRFKLGETWVHLHKQARKALSRRCLHFAEGRVQIRS